jgi:hypothetical protein
MSGDFVGRVGFYEGNLKCQDQTLANTLCSGQWDFFQERIEGRFSLSDEQKAVFQFSSPYPREEVIVSHCNVE